jgi:phosphatidylserine/phosphatidylglycerophosphate/cardiolipin synthase-like enzyme
MADSQIVPEGKITDEWTNSKPYFIKNDLNDVNIFIGRKAGKYIIEDIENAKKHVKIISPYLGLDKIKLLIELYKKGIKVEVITTDDSRDFKYPASSELLKELIKQEPVLLENAKRKRRIFLIFLVLFIIIGIISPLVISFLGYKNLIYNQNVLYFLVLYLLIIIICFRYYKSWKIYEYKYYTVFPIMFIKKKKHFRKRNYYSLLHTKLYIIDDLHFYTGSINFSKSGMINNHEISIKIKDKTTQMKLTRYFDFLYKKNWQKWDISLLGRMIYKEPVN